MHESCRGVRAHIRSDFITETFIGVPEDLPLAICVEAGTIEDMQDAVHRAVDDHLAVALSAAAPGSGDPPS